MQLSYIYTYIYTDGIRKKIKQHVTSDDAGQDSSSNSTNGFRTPFWLYVQWSDKAWVDVMQISGTILFSSKIYLFTK